MSPLQQKPILHGRDHCPGGADPIPCMISGPSGNFETVVLSISDLLAYWRLGEPGEPWEDTSGVVGTTPADLDEAESGTAPTPDVTGALGGGQDDGALELNYDGTGTSGGRYARSTFSGGTTKDFDLGTAPGEFTVIAWAKVKASALSRRGLIAGTSVWSISGGGYMAGWGLQVVYPARTVRFTIGETDGSTEIYAETAGGVVADEWNFFAGTYDGTTARLYANGVLVDSMANPSNVPASPDHRMQIGYGYSSATDPDWYYGTADEVAVWTRALTQAEIDALYNAGVEGAGEGEMALLSDGAGGTYWGQVPPQAMEPGDEGEVLKTSGGAVVWDSAPGGDPAEDALVWMPLADSDGTLVLDAGDNVIPTLIPI